MSQSKSIPLNALPNEKTNIIQWMTNKWICLLPYTIIYIIFSSSVHNSPFTFFTYTYFFIPAFQIFIHFTYLIPISSSRFVLFFVLLQKIAVLQAASRGAGDVQSGGASSEEPHL